MPRVSGMFARRIMLDINCWQSLLRLVQQTVAILKVLRIILIQHAIEATALQGRCGLVMHIAAPAKAAAASPISGWSAGFGYDVEIMGYMTQVVQITAVSVPGKDLESPHVGNYCKLRSMEAPYASAACASRNWIRHKSAYRPFLSMSCT